MNNTVFLLVGTVVTGVLLVFFLQATNLLGPAVLEAVAFGMFFSLLIVDLGEK